jgi:putative phage-type endonuclease
MIDFTDCDIIACKDEAEWLVERARGVGASEAGVILGLSDWSSPTMLWAQKTGKIPTEGIDTDMAEWGHFMEPGAADRYAFRSGRKLVDIGKYTILRSKKWPWLQATLDRVVPSMMTVTGGHSEAGVVEVKNPTMFGHHKWDDGPPLAYQCQLQTQLAVTGFSWGSFAASMPSGKLQIIDCERQPDFIALLVEKTKAFWDCVQSGRAPEVDGSQWTTEAIKRLHPKDNGESVVLPAEAATWAEKLESAKATIKSLEAIQREAENRLRAAIGDATFGTVGDLKFSYKTQARAEHLVKESEFRVLRKVGK